MDTSQLVNSGSIFRIETAVREKVKIKMALTGPSGSGKTFSALLLGYGIAGDWGKVYVADTESKSAIFYAGADRTGDWKHIDFPSTIKGGYHPQNWMALIEMVEKTDAEVLILDSFSQEYIGENGLLDVADKSSLRGNTFTGWKVATPMQRVLLEKIRSSRLHIVATMRAVTEYSVEKNDKGKSAPVKIGLKPQQRDGTDYEFDIMFDLDMSHNAMSNKDRSGLFTGRGGFRITPEIGRELHEWSMQGIAAEDKEFNFNPEHIEILRSLCSEMGTTDIVKQREIAKKMRDQKVIMRNLKESIQALKLAEIEEG